MIKAVIFDLDGTLSYTLDSISISGNKALEEIGLPIYEKERYKYFCGDGADELVKRLIISNGYEEGEEFDSIYEKLRPLYSKYFKEYAEYNVRPYDKMPQTIEALKQNGLKLAVLSNKPHPQTIEVVEKLYGKGTFDFILGNIPDIPRKPSSAGALLIADKLDVAVSDCLYVGDTATDMQTGNGAGMNTVGVLWGYRTREELSENHAKHIIDSPEEILNLV